MPVSARPGLPRTGLLALAAAAAAGLAGCATGGTGGLPPAQVVRYHLDQPIARGTIEVVAAGPEAGPLGGPPIGPGPGGPGGPGAGPAGGPGMGPGMGGLAFAPFAGAVQSQLARVGYTPAAPGVAAEFVAVTQAHQEQQVGPPRPSPFSIGLGGAGFSGGRGGGVGLGGGIGFPVGGGGRRAVLFTELSVTIKRRADQVAVWEGHARGAVDARSPAATADAQAGRLAAALFAGFPGESGRTVDVR